jgi:hypothetical protein
MARFSGGGTRSGTNSANTAYFGVMNAASATASARIREIGIGVSVAPSTAPAFYLSRITAIGSFTATTTLAGQLADPSNTTTSQWTFQTINVGPTFSTANFLRYGGLAVTAGGMLIWTFYDEPLIVAPASSVNTIGMAIVNANASGATTGTFFGYAVWDE